MESIYTELDLYGSKNECARTDTDFLPISEVCDGKVSIRGHKEETLKKSLNCKIKKIKINIKL